MKHKTVLLVVVANLAVLILLAIFAPRLMISPGTTIQAHAGFAGDCFACHAPFTGSAAARCIACHKVEEIGIMTSKGQPIDKERKNVAFHQKLVETDCVACHSDHKGVMAFRPIKRFSHDLLDPSLRDGCHGCHVNPGDALHRKIKGNCVQCHKVEGWTPATFEHTRYFRFDRNHDTACETCHVGSDYANYTCYGCHEHSRSKIREEHYEEGIRDYENCVECHRSGDEDEAEWRWRSRGGAGSDGGERRYEGGYRNREHDD